MSMTTLAHLLAHGPSGIVIVAGKLSRQRLTALSRLRKAGVFYVDCKGVRTKRALMAALRRGLRLPDYFGANWDALADCLTDLAWAPADGYVLLFDGLDGLASASRPDYESLLDVLDGAVEAWRGQGVPFDVILAGDAAVLDSNLPVLKAD